MSKRSGTRHRVQASPRTTSCSASRALSTYPALWTLPVSLPATLHSAMSKLLDSVPGLASKVMSPATRDARARDTYENLGAEVVIAG